MNREKWYAHQDHVYARGNPSTVIVGPSHNEESRLQSIDDHFLAPRHQISCWKWRRGHPSPIVAVDSTIVFRSKSCSSSHFPCFFNRASWSFYSRTHWLLLFIYVRMWRCFLKMFVLQRGPNFDKIFSIFSFNKVLMRQKAKKDRKYHCKMKNFPQGAKNWNLSSTGTQE